MVFSSTIFLFLFLPAVILVYYGLLRKRTHRNIFLTAASLLFYAWGEPWFVFVMLASITMNWTCGRLIGRFEGDRKKQKRVVAESVALNLGLLAVFKYTDFLLSNVNSLFRVNHPLAHLAMHIGISFFTFQAMSYVIDVYRGKGQVQKSWLNVCLYIAFFPQLIAGPIVRYETVANELLNRRENMDDFHRGVRRFVMGFCKKVLLANNLALLGDAMFATPAAQLSVADAWLGDFAYALQVFFDFAGYSDMAIGLGLIFGFHFLENFDYPYISKSISEFWRRWHMSMGTWFRDYLYFPMGGSRVKKARGIFNLFVLWGLMGLWHGANWTYIIWGLMFFVIQVFERETKMEKRWTRFVWLRYVYTLFLIMITSVVVRASNITYAFQFLGRMFGAGGAPLTSALAAANLKQYIYFLLFGTLCSVPLGRWLKAKFKVSDFWSSLIGNTLLLGLFLVAVSYVVQGSYNPFIYFNF